LVAPLAERPDERPTSGEAWLTALERTRPRRRRWAIAALAVIVAAGVARLVWGPAPPSDTPPRLAVMPFAVLGTPPYPATQLPEYFVSRFRPVERVIEVLSFGRVVAQTGTAPPSNEEARDLAARLGARFFVQGSVSYAGPTVTLTATLYEGNRARRSGKATGRDCPRTASRSASPSVRRTTRCPARKSARPGARRDRAPLRSRAARCRSAPPRARRREPRSPAPRVGTGRRNTPAAAWPGKAACRAPRTASPRAGAGCRTAE